MNETYQLIRSNRKTISLELTSKGLLVRAPHAMTKEQIDLFVKSSGKAPASTLNLAAAILNLITATLLRGDFSCAQTGRSVFRPQLHHLADDPDGELLHLFTSEKQRVIARVRRQQRHAGGR